MSIDGESRIPIPISYSIFPLILSTCFRKMKPTPKNIAKLLAKSSYICYNGTDNNYHLKRRKHIMNDNLQELVFILDQSASIKDHLETASKSFKKLISDQKKLPVQTNVTTNIFGSDYVTLFNGLPIEKVKFTQKLFPTSGVCPLIDSAVRSIDAVGERLSNTPEQDRPSKVIVTIVTFNRDNASKKHTFEELAERIRVQTEVYKWKFYLITDFSINMEKLGIAEDDTIILKKSDPDAFKTAYGELNKKITALRIPE